MQTSVQFLKRTVFSIAEMSVSCLLKPFTRDLCFLWFKSQFLSLTLQFSLSLILVLFSRMGTSLKLEKVRKCPVVPKLLDSLCLQILVSLPLLHCPECCFLLFWLAAFHHRTNKAAQLQMGLLFLCFFSLMCNLFVNPEMSGNYLQIQLQLSQYILAHMYLIFVALRCDATPNLILSDTYFICHDFNFVVSNLVQKTLSD